MNANSSGVSLNNAGSMASFLLHSGAGESEDIETVIQDTDVKGSGNCLRVAESLAFIPKSDTYTQLYAPSCLHPK